MAFKRVLSVSDLSVYVKGVFDDEMFLHNLTVFGEVEEMKTSGGTTYLTLRDDVSRISCVLFSVCECFPKGVSVELDGGVRFYQKTGKVSFVARDIRLRGESGRHLAFLKLKERLEKEGIFSDKKQMPARICTVAVVTSETGAVIHDFISVLRSAGVTADIIVFPVRVQGKDAEGDILAASKRVAACKRADVCVFMRGGGSEGDLEVFNTETAARAVKSCPVYTISAVGHETDTTLCDLAADARAGTPSIAAAMIKEQFFAAWNRVRTLAESLTAGVERIVHKQNIRLAAAVQRVSASAEQKIALGLQKTEFLSKALASNINYTMCAKSELLKNVCTGLGAAIEKKAESARQSLANTSVRLDAQSPLKMLAKGYARAEKDGCAVQTAGSLSAGDAVTLYFEDGKADARIQQVRLRAGGKHGV